MSDAITRLKLARTREMAVAKHAAHIAQQALIEIANLPGYRADEGKAIAIRAVNEVDKILRVLEEILEEAQ